LAVKPFCYLEKDFVLFHFQIDNITTIVVKNSKRPERFEEFLGAVPYPMNVLKNVEAEISESH
jgi:hypothetical protein